MQNSTIQQTIPRNGYNPSKFIQTNVIQGKLSETPTAYGIYLPYTVNEWQYGVQKLDSYDWRQQYGRYLQNNLSQFH
jgi:hypothetical protein